MKRTISHVFDAGEDSLAKWDRGADVVEWVSTYTTSFFRLQAAADGYYVTGSIVRLACPEVEISRHKAEILGAWVLAGDQPRGTLIRCRLCADGVDLFYAGGVWRAAAADEWFADLVALNTALAVAPFAFERVRLVLGLGTADKRRSPSITAAAIAIAIDGLGSVVEEVVARDLFARLREDVAAEASLVVGWPATGASIDLSSVGSGQVEPIEIVDVLGLYSDFGGHGETGENLLAAYNSGTKIATSIEPIAAGARVLLRLRVVVDFAIVTHPDFYEIAKTPAIVVEAIDEETTGEPVAETHFPYLSTAGGYNPGGEPLALVVPPPVEIDLVLRLRALGSRSLEVLRLVEDVESSLRSRPVLGCGGTGEEVILQIAEGQAYSPRPDNGHAQDATISVRLRGVKRWISRDGRAGRHVATLNARVGTQT